MLLYYCYDEMEMILWGRFSPATILIIIDNQLHDNNLRSLYLNLFWENIFRD